MPHHLLAVWQADGGNVRAAVKVHESVHLDDGDVVVKVSGIVLGVDVEVLHVELDVGIEL